VVLACVSLPRRWPWKFTSALRGLKPLPSPSSLSLPSLRTKLLIDAWLSMSVPSTVKCSSLVSPAFIARRTTPSKKAATMPCFSSRGRLCVKVV
jgi:hypothetical protein